MRVSATDRGRWLICRAGVTDVRMPPTNRQIMENQEIQHTVQILGLQYGRKYESVQGLRYGHLMLMTDQDHDGSHIKGLLINFLHTFWPSLLLVPGFLLEFITPIVKATRSKHRDMVFYTMPEYEQWKATTDGAKGWKVKYYKGLGTSTSQEAKEYFSSMQQHQLQFAWEDDADSAAIELAFSKKRADDRKEWLRQFKPGTFLNHAVQEIKYKDFINRELILFSMADNVRSIPCVVDGFKPAQRKVLFACFKRKLREEIKVAQLAGYVSEHSAYHHGEQSLAGTIINMAQDYVGSNNIALLEPVGQFGTRLQGGKDAASPRYIFTRLSPIARLMFPPADDAVRPRRPPCVPQLRRQSQPPADPTVAGVAACSGGCPIPQRSHSCSPIWTRMGSASSPSGMPPSYRWCS